jgi:uncharacterized protein
MRRFSLADLPDTIPVFPLSGALLLPRTRLPLNIFEPRYLAMFDDCMKTSERLIGMIQPLENGRRMQQIGCAGRMTSFTETEDGRYLVTLGGVCRFRLGAEVEGFSPYRRFGVDWKSFERDLGPSEDDPAFDRDAFLSLLARFFETTRLSSDWDALKTADAELLINSLSILCPFEAEDKQALLEAPSLVTRRETLVMLMEFALRGGLSGDGPLQ